MLSGPTGPPGLPLFNTIAPFKNKFPPHSNSHYMEQNPFLVSPSPSPIVSVTAATAAAVKRNIVNNLYNYNPVTETSAVKTFNSYPRQHLTKHSLRLLSTLSLIFSPSQDRSDIGVPSAGGPMDVTPSPSLVMVTSPSAAESAADQHQPTGYSYKNVHWPKAGMSTGYNNFHFQI